MIDRIAPTRRPEGSAAGYQRWRMLTFLHWRVPESVLRPLVPAGLTLDTFDGECFVGVVPFTMQGVRPRFAPAVPGLSRFHETNVRTYVHLAGGDPGVWFFSLDAANRIAVGIGRTLWHLAYHHARMSLDVVGDEIRYASSRRSQTAVCHLTSRPQSAPSPAKVGTLEHFLAERYVMYAQKNGMLLRGQVHHAPYPLQTAQIVAWEESLLAASGIARPPGEPFAHYAAGVDVEVFAMRICK
jgi:uncharacterized protein YqjF (DUF2071 family)